LNRSNKSDDDPFSYSSDLRAASNNQQSTFGFNSSPFSFNNTPFEDEGKDSFG
jgi:hypothetical protein